MPLYEYLCQSCDRKLELLVQGSQKPTCPNCGGDRLTKLLSLVAAPGRDGGDRVMAEITEQGCGAQCACYPQN